MPRFLLEDNLSARLVVRNTFRFRRMRAFREEEKNKESEKIRKHRISGTYRENVRVRTGDGSGEDIRERSEETEEQRGEEDTCRMPVT